MPLRRVVVTVLIACAPLMAAARETASPPEVILDARPRPMLDRFTLSVTGIFTFRAALDEVLLGGGPDLRLGMENRWRGMALHLAFERGEVRIGLPYEVIVGGPELWWRPMDTVSVGCGADLGSLAVLRATRSDRMWTVFLGVHAASELQLGPRTRVGVLVLLVRVALEVLTATSQLPSASLSTTVGLGVRFGGAGRWP
ncbi:MAG: hypothetical protein HY906_20250 [Deltaproteobacteria bacterium]|nr:hypothetical protein [Deltaproteobacteria bacterium]